MLCFYCTTFCYNIPPLFSSLSLLRRMENKGFLAFSGCTTTHTLMRLNFNIFFIYFSSLTTEILCFVIFFFVIAVIIVTVFNAHKRDSLLLFSFLSSSSIYDHCTRFTHSFTLPTSTTSQRAIVVVTTFSSHSQQKRTKGIK